MRKMQIIDNRNKKIYCATKHRIEMSLLKQKVAVNSAQLLGGTVRFFHAFCFSSYETDGQDP